ncbi:hypothetical protein [Salinibacterium sp. ZJ450]|uniref:hypothetical protein n=1 Tax=Salinibacterium sp. ZJ450 TaxID=2708338 RepID=UPI00142027F8|nr:hypothetical protein [Salinibacterium sp. ZJ450]
MKISISLSDKATLAALPLIEVNSVSRLEGYNGVGKSTAVRILMLCTGTMPYRDSERAWQSLKDSLGPVTVRVDGLSDDKSIAWRFDTHKWQDLLPPVADHWFESIEIDGHKVTLQEVTELFTVYRLAGDVGVLETLASQIDQYADGVAMSRSAFGPSDTSPGIHASTLLQTVKDELSVVNAGVVSEDQRRLDLAEGAAKRASEQIESARTHIDKIDETIEIFDQVREVESEGPNLARRTHEASEALQRAQAQRERLDDALEKMAVAASLGADISTQLLNAEKTYKRNHGNLKSATVRLTEAVTELNVDPNAQNVLSAAEKSRETIRVLGVRIDELSASPNLLALSERVTTELDNAINAGMGHESILRRADSLRPEVAQLRDDIDRRRSEMRSELESKDARDLAQQRQHEARRLASLEGLPELIDEVERLNRLTESAKTRLAELAKSPNLEASQKLEELRGERDFADSEIIRLAGEHAKLLRQHGLLGGGRNAEWLNTELQTRRKELGLSAEDDLVAEAKRLQQELADRERRQTHIIRDLEDARALFNQHQEDLLASRDSLLNSPEYAWLRDGLSALLARQNDDRETILARQTDLDHRVTKALDLLNTARITAITLEEALRYVARVIRGTADESTPRYHKEVVVWLEQQFSIYFSQAEVSELLMGTGATDVHVDLIAASLNWTRQSGESDSRPLEAFSSGQQAFAYTRARLGLIDSRPAKPLNRLVCLDEFGAFMAEDIRDSLYTDLQVRSASNPLDHYLLILPVAQDYEASALSALPSERKALSAIADQIETAGYHVKQIY